jgi:hypothetical protein
MEKEYTVIVHNREDLANLEQELVDEHGTDIISCRCVHIKNKRSGSKIQTHFMLTDEEADYRAFTTSILGSPNRHLFSRYGKQPFSITGSI